MRRKVRKGVASEDFLNERYESDPTAFLEDFVDFVAGFFFVGIILPRKVDLPSIMDDLTTGCKGDIALMVWGLLYSVR